MSFLGDKTLKNHNIMKTNSSAKIFDYGVFGFIKINLRGAAQVMFQPSAWTGLLFLAGIFWGGYTTGYPAMAWGALLGLVISTITGFILNLPAEDGCQGLWGFNGILVGCAFPVFMGNTLEMWLSLVLCAAFTTWLRTGLNNVMKPWKVNSFTFPFVLSTWFFLLAAHVMRYLQPTHHAAHHIAHHAAVSTDSFWGLVQAWLNGVSQVFLIESWVTGALFLIGLALCSRWAALWAAIGSALAMATSYFMGVPHHAISAGLYGFSAVLTAIALATVFYRPCWRSALWALFGIVITVFVQAAMNMWVEPYSIATLTGPFCVTTWLFLLPMFKLDEAQPDHSSWSAEIKQHLSKEDEQ